MIRIGNIKAGDTGEYCGRPSRSRHGSPLANPFYAASEADRDKVCDQYEEWLADQIARGAKAVMDELARLESIARSGDLTLLCWCSSELVQRRCHCESIKRRLEERLKI